MTLEQWIPIFIVLFSAVMGILAYSHQKWADRAENIRKEKLATYVELLRALPSKSNANETSASDIDNAIEKLILYGSTPVLNAWHDQYLAIKALSVQETAETIAEFRRNHAKVLLKMRQDIRGHKEDTPKDIMQILWD